ncbi:MAG: hypothetical protein ABMA01_10205 [Chthoniobacteraceae bacterium]
MKLLRILVAALLAGAFVSQGEDKDYPEVRKFAEAIKGVVWDLRGTNSLKHLRFDGENIEALTPDGRATGKYEYAFVDAGVFRLNFKGPNAGWYFVSDDAKFITPTTVSFEFEFKAAQGSPAKRVRNFPEDIKGVLWEGDRDGKKFRLQWDGTALDVSVLDKAWKRERLTPTVANRRVFESVAENDAVIWFVFSEDGTEGWLLQMADVFGGHAHAVPRRAALGAAETGLPNQLNDAANHAEDLVQAGDRMRAGTLVRSVTRKLGQKSGRTDNAAALRNLSKRFGAER